MNDELRKERIARILATMNGEKTDRPPLMWAGDLALIRYARPDWTFRQMIDEHEEMTQIICDEVMPKFPKVDYLAAVGMSSEFLGAAFAMPTALPGRQLPEDEMWQVQFEHWMDEDIYERIVNEGWAPINEWRLFTDIGYDPEAMGKSGEAGFRNMQRYEDTGNPFSFGGMLCSPFDILTFGRGQIDFYTDLFEEGDVIKAAMNVMMEEEFARMGDQIDKEVAEAEARGEVVMYAMAPCVQANAGLLGRAQFEEFGWPLIERQANFLLDHGAYVRFHMDANWTAFLDLFTCFPKGKCIFDSDGNTDLAATRDILGPTMGFTGTVHPAVFAFGTPDEVYNDVKEQIEVMGDSFIASPSCSIPANAPKENIDAMYAAIDEL